MAVNSLSVQNGKPPINTKKYINILTTPNGEYVVVCYKGKIRQVFNPNGDLIYYKQ